MIRWRALPFFEKLPVLTKADRYWLLFLALTPVLATGATAYYLYRYFLYQNQENLLSFVGLAYLASSGVVFVDILHDKIADRPATWPLWFISVVFITAAVGTISILALLEDIYTATFLLALVFLLFALLPRLLAWLNRGLRLIPLLGPTAAWILTAPNLYSMIIMYSGFLMVKFFFKIDWIMDDVYEQLTIIGLTLLVVLPAVLFRKMLWKATDYGLLTRMLPHLSVMTWMIFILMDSDFLKDLLFLNREIFGPIAVFSTLIAPLSLIVLGVIKLRRQLVDPLTDQKSDYADSIQSNVERYVDVHGHVEQLVGSVIRSDGGAFGITGVRGAGKSALSRKLLDSLKKQYFTLELTAPVRHGDDMAFFVSLCRGVCRSVLDDLTKALQGVKGGARTELTGLFRNVLLGFGGLVAVISLLPPTVISLLPLISDMQGGTVTADLEKDYLLGRGYSYTRTLVRDERSVIDNLLTQMDVALVGFSATNKLHNNNTQYLLVPNPSTFNFWLLRQGRGSDPKKNLVSYQDSIGQKGSKLFLFYRDFRELRNPIWPVWNDYMKRGYKEAGKSKNAAKDVREDWLAYRKAEEASQEVLWGQANAREVQEAYLQAQVTWNASTKDATEEIFKTSKSEIINWLTIKAPLKHLSRELRSFLLSKPDNQSETGENANEADLVSALIFKAFQDADPKLSFNLERLKEFREVLLVYRHLLDGENITRPQAAGQQEVTISAWMAKELSLENILFWLAVLTIIVILLAGPIWGALSRLIRAALNYKYLVLYREARDFMDELTYQDSQEFSGGFAFRGLSFGRKRTLMARDLTLPGLTARYLEFVQLIRQHYNGKMVIVIDELDKIHDPEQVKSLLTEIKGALFAEGVFYLISISEDAARSFRHRLSSQRDIFESTFDNIIEIRQMEVEAAEQMLAKRDENIDEDDRISKKALPVIALFGGGIPREIIRSRIPVIEAGKPNEATPTITAEILLQQAITEWLDHIRESNLSGEETIRLRDCVKQAVQILENSPNPGAGNDSLWECLEECLDIIDPKSLRFADESEYQHIAYDLQACIRLMILTHLYELIQSGENSWLEKADRFLECFSTLADKPALAEKLLTELRS